MGLTRRARSCGQGLRSLRSGAAGQQQAVASGRFFPQHQPRSLSPLVRYSAERHPVTATTYVDPTTSDLVTIDISRSDSVVRISAVGEIDSTSAPVLRERLEDVLA